MPETKLKLGVIVGSLRKESYSRKIADALVERAPDGWQCSHIAIGDLPLYNEDLDAKPPKEWLRFRDEVKGSDALLFVTPEYNRSIPGVLKNATDIGSRPQGENIFDGLPAAIVSVTPYSGGGMAANHALRQSFVYINLAIMQQPEAYISEAAKLLDEDGKVSSQKADKLLRDFMRGFERWIDRVGTNQAAPFDAFMKEREKASNAYIEGVVAPLEAIATRHDPATFFPPDGKTVVGAKAASKAHGEGAKSFKPGSKGRFEILASGSGGGLAWWSGVQHASVRLEGKQEAVEMKLRTTEVFRFEDGGWKLVHRHADMMDKG